jgi:hypothetical protein
MPEDIVTAAMTRKLPTFAEQTRHDLVPAGFGLRHRAAFLAPI